VFVVVGITSIQIKEAVFVWISKQNILITVNISILF
jgi:hypothetical protein